MRSKKSNNNTDIYVPQFNIEHKYLVAMVPIGKAADTYLENAPVIECSIEYFPKDRSVKVMHDGYYTSWFVDQHFDFLVYSGKIVEILD